MQGDTVLNSKHLTQSLFRTIVPSVELHQGFFLTVEHCINIAKKKNMTIARTAIEREEFLKLGTQRKAWPVMPYVTSNKFQRTLS